MTTATVNRLTILFGFCVGLLSALVALVQGGDLFFILVERFVVVFLVSGALTWLALTVISSVVVGAARQSVAELDQSLRAQIAEQDDSPAIDELAEHFKEALSKGTNLDLTSEADGGLDLLTDSDASAPGIKEFEPFKPPRVEPGNADS